MTERERLIKFLNDATFGVNVHTLADHLHKETIEAVADYLLANGVIVPPCKVGDTVYIIENRDMLNIDPSVCSVTDDEIYEMGYGRTQSGELKWLFLVLETGEDFYDDEVGKTVFLTKEEAEKALAERSNR
jgi:hypothetical protein